MIWPFGMSADEPVAPTKSATQLAEDKASIFLNGTPEGETCSLSRHSEATRLEKLVLLRALKIEFPHQSTNVFDLELAIRKESKKK